MPFLYVPISPSTPSTSLRLKPVEDQCTNLPRDKVIAVHGSMDRAACANCGEESDYAEFCERVRTQIKDLSGKDPSAPQESRPIICSNCGRNTMKPDIVLFRSSLPATFFENVPRDVRDADMLIVMGTSLRVVRSHIPFGSVFRCESW